MDRGIAASSGVAIGRAHIIKKEIEVKKYRVENANEEIDRLDRAISIAKDEIEKIKDASVNTIGEKNAKVFEAHLMILEDVEFINSIKNRIYNDKINAEYAVKLVSYEYSQIFLNMENEYFKERASDIKDVGNRIINILSGSNNNSIINIHKKCIIVADDITPSETAQMNKELVLGIATNLGGKTSHSAIIARTLEIPAVLGLGNITDVVKEGDILILDGDEGIVIINPDDETVKRYKEKQQKINEEKSELLKYKNIIVNKNGRLIEIAANIGKIEEVDLAVKYGADGIGLFRTEFLYMDKETLPTEDEQFEAYKHVLEKMEGKPVIIRTLDIGGDKHINYLNLEKEQNPFLGLRAIRLCLNRIDLFKAQLRALLRASIYGNLRIMFPMISGLKELRKAKGVLKEVEEELSSQGIKYSNDYKLGIMIEVPSAAIISDMLAKEVDFFSIGTNDLIQYTLAVDRMNQNVSYLYEPSHPAILRLIKTVIDNAHREGIWVGMCGEMASDLSMTETLFEMGLDEFSVSPPMILNLKKKLGGTYEGN
ncbi:phosphoenolpyruvate--protein phosphotransferase [Caloramator sp. CAR-1]|uniref:phosphoenolpyruvate--protein phosphotransferase n=1 Tax=Caloramator sp. CAR-1 TaxID=3062777 RepID=UPI0026E487DC|nr:phosphoenolpyruvate--protein phosphotransferase [Caloramator sp. CAR-1]MDO6354906.1 phosphoenolpyruvate--protein phosphotransferase [Caloramator sp. CAR-1]